MSIQEQLVEAYDEDGQYGVYDWVEKNHPDWDWEHCEPCDSETPTWDGVCAVCFTPRET